MQRKPSDCKADLILVKRKRIRRIGQGEQGREYNADLTNSTNLMCISSTNKAVQEGPALAEMARSLVSYHAQSPTGRWSGKTWLNAAKDSKGPATKTCQLTGLLIAKNKFFLEERPRSTHPQWPHISARWKSQSTFVKIASTRWS